MLPIPPSHYKPGWSSLGDNASGLSIPNQDFEGNECGPIDGGGNGGGGDDDGGRSRTSFTHLHDDLAATCGSATTPSSSARRLSLNWSLLSMQHSPLWQRHRALDSPTRLQQQQQQGSGGRRRHGSESLASPSSGHWRSGGQTTAASTAASTAKGLSRVSASFGSPLQSVMRSPSPRCPQRDTGAKSATRPIVSVAGRKGRALAEALCAKMLPSAMLRSLGSQEKTRVRVQRMREKTSGLICLWYLPSGNCYIIFL